MKKTAILLVAMLLVSMFAFASCNLPWIQKECTEHTDADANYVCDVCGVELEKEDTPADVCEHVDENKDHVCDLCGGPSSRHADYDKDHLCDFCGGVFTECADVTRDHMCDLCGATLSEHYDENPLNHYCDFCKQIISDCVDAVADHKCDICGALVSACRDDMTPDHACDICGEIVSVCLDADEDWECDVCGGDVIPSTHEKVSYSLNISDLTAGTLAQDEINGKFTIVSGSEIRNRTKEYNGVEYNKSVKIGNSATKIKVDVPGSGKLSFIIQNGSSSAATQFVTVTAPDGTVHDIEFAGTDQGSPLVMVELKVTEGVWTISRGKNGGTQDVYALDLSCIVAKSDENGFEIVSEGKVNYLEGQPLDLSGMRLNSTFANGKTEPLSVDDVLIDRSEVDMSTTGVYPVYVSYKDYDAYTVYVSVYAPQSIELGFDAIEKLAQNSSAGNGVYYNHSFKELYFVGEELDLTGLSVTVVGKCGDETLKFNVGNNYEIGGFDSSDMNSLTITVSYASVSTSFEIWVTDAVPTPNENGVYMGLVDPEYLAVPGALSGPYHCFSTIQEALDYFAKIDPNAPKEIYIAPGLYREKLEIEIPNLKLIGWSDTADEVVIEWDSLYGLVDASGFTHVTDSTYTVAIRESAYNVTIDNLTISNYWNTQERMDEAGLAIERGLALLVQSDRFVMTNSKLLGIQDTLELFTGRQYFENVYISGYTDFIFGTNNTTYFKNCTIHVIDTEKDDKGTAGYITAFKGSNKGANDAIVYGAIFDGCKFTADDGVTAGRTAIGRTWGAYAAVAVMNSELGGHISVAGYNPSNNKNTRYISMNGIHPTDSTVQFVEFNNTGAGAITEAVAGMRFLTADEAKLYADFETIFGTINGKVSYLDSWNPLSTEIVVDDRDYYYFNGTSSTTGTSHTFDTTTTIASGSTLEWDGLLISAENGRVAWNQNANALNMKAGAFIKFTVAAGTTVTVETYPNYNFFTLNGVGTSSANMLSQYYAEATEVTILSTGDLYIYSIIINPGEEAPAAPTLDQIKASGLKLNYTVGEELNLSDLVVKAYYSDNSLIAVNANVDTSAVNNAVAGSYDVVISFGGQTVVVTVTFEGPNEDPAITDDIVLDFTTPEGLEAVLNNPKVTITGNVRHNGGEIQIQGTISFDIKGGTLVEVIPYASTDYASFTIGDLEDTSEVYHTSVIFQTGTDCTFVYTGLENNYLCKIIIKCPVNDGKYVFGGSSEEGDVTGILESVPGISIMGDLKTHSGGAQLNETTFIEFRIPAFTTMVIKGYDTNYGQLNVAVGGEYLEMNSDACYVYTTGAAWEYVSITAKNVGTEESPAYNKSYITYIDVKALDVISDDLVVNFGSEGNYKDCGIDFSGASIRDNGGNNSQISSGTFSFIVEAGAVVTINGYPGYTSYGFTDGNINHEISTEKYVYVAERKVMLTITPMNSNNYFYSISVAYPKAFDESATITFGSEGNYKDSIIDFSGANIRDNGGNNSQISSGSFSFVVMGGATVTVNGYPGYTSYMVDYGYVTTEEITADTYSFEIYQAALVTITPVNGNNYFYSIKVEYSEGGAEEPEVPAHACESVCSECGKCTDVACEETACADKCQGHEVAGETKEEVTYVLDTTKDLTAMAQGDKADGDSQVVADFFTIHYSAKTKIDSSNKTFEDGYTASQRISWGGKTSVKDGKNYIEFTVTDAATVTVWWVSGGDGRTLELVNADGTSMGTVGAESAKNALYINKFTVESAGTYYLTSPIDSNYIFKVEVETTK